MANIGYIQVVRHCNHFCGFCSNPTTPYVHTFETMRVLVDDFVERGYFGVILTGGEPSLHPELPAIARYATDRGLHVRMITNGWRLADDGFAREMAEAGLRIVHVSVYSVRPDVEAQLRGMQGTLEKAFAAVENIPSIRAKAAFCQKWTDQVYAVQSLASETDRRRFVLNLTAFAACIEGLFFFGAFAYVYFLRSRGLLPGLAAGTNWVFRDESAHMAFAFEVLRTVRREQPELFDEEWASAVRGMITEAVDCESQFADDVLSGGVVGMTRAEMRQYLEYVADQRLAMLQLPAIYGARNPFHFMELQDVQELTNFFERTVSAYQTAVTGDFALDDDF